MCNLKHFLVFNLVVFSLLFSGCVTYVDEEPLDANTISVKSDGTKDFGTIQAAIDNAPDNYTVYVYAGVYIENLVINRSIVLKGQAKETTIIDGNHTGDVIYVEETGKLNISGFTVRNSGKNYASAYDAGIDIQSDHNLVYDMIFTGNSIGIYSTHSHYNIFRNNIYNGNVQYGMYLYAGSNYAFTEDNVFINNDCALRIKGSTYNTVTRNVFKDNSEGMYFCCGSRLNIVFHNTFINNTDWNSDDQVSGNEWDSGYPLGGNYWDDYTGIDIYSGEGQNISGSDGIGDTPYEVSDHYERVDRYPLMEPIVTVE
jgi:parallel beta-helix repeat protein